MLAAVPVAPVAKATPHPPQPTHEPSSANPDIKLSDGRVFHDAVVIASDPASITIRYCGGIARVDLATLPEDDRAKLAPQYDPQKAAAYKAAEARALDEAAQVQETQAVMDRFDANALNFSGKVVQVSESGAIMEGGGHTDDQTKEVMINGTSTKVATLPGKSTDYDSVFVAGAGDGMVDGDHWSGKVWMAGRYQYTTVMGAIRTIPRLAADRDLALRLLGSGK